MALVYSTDAGRMCPACRQALQACICKPLAQQPPAGDGFTRVSREKQGRAGKVVTVVQGLPADAAGLQTWGKRLRSGCGAGGTTKDGVIEIQGDHVERVLALLAEGGLRAKRAGG